MAPLAYFKTVPPSMTVVPYRFTDALLVMKYVVSPLNPNSEMEKESF